MKHAIEAISLSAMIILGSFMFMATFSNAVAWSALPLVKQAFTYPVSDRGLPAVTDEPKVEEVVEPEPEPEEEAYYDEYDYYYEEYTPYYGGYTGGSTATNTNDLLNGQGRAYDDSGIGYTWYYHDLGYDALDIPGETFDADGVSHDADGYIVVAADGYEKGEVISTPYGDAKVYDSGSGYGTVDIYTNR